MTLPRGLPPDAPRPSFPRPETLRDPRFWLLLAAILALATSFVSPPWRARAHGVDLLAVVDITGSMNTRDYMRDGKPESRLEHVKASLRSALSGLPCPARLGLAIFTERQPFLLFEPIDVCADFAPVDGALAALDWRMAWEGDSHIAAGLYGGVAMARSLDADLLFFTDGQEAPPLPASGGPQFDGERGAVKGLIVGTGGYSPSPIPKFDDDGREVGFYAMADVPQENRFGLPPADAQQREGYNPRNAPFGAVAATGNEHLSSLREAYLKELAGKTGLAYARLDEPGELLRATLASSRECEVDVLRESRPYVLALALILIIFAFALPPIENFLRAMRGGVFDPLLWRKS